MPVPIVKLGASEVLHMIQRSDGTLSAARKCAIISVVGIETPVNVTPEAIVAVKPRAGADEHAVYKPFRSVIAVGGAIVGRKGKIAIGANGLRPSGHSHLCRRMHPPHFTTCGKDQQQ
jgi:hypothetical protein